MKKYFVTMIFAGLMLLAINTPGQANTEELKIYRTVYPDLKPNCQYCHIDKLPKKDDGKHDLNAYGTKLKEMMGASDLTEEMIQSAGKHDQYGE